MVETSSSLNSPWHRLLLATSDSLQWLRGKRGLVWVLHIDVELVTLALPGHPLRPQIEMFPDHVVQARAWILAAIRDEKSAGQQRNCERSVHPIRVAAPAWL